MTEEKAVDSLSNVVIIDDDDISNFIYTRVVSASGLAKNIKSFLSGKDALSFLEETAENNPDNFPELIFLDINMPVMNGWDFLDLYQHTIPKVLQDRVVFCVLSSSVYKEDIRKAKSYSQVHEYVPKPLTTEAFFNLVNKYFG